MSPRVPVHLLGLCNLVAGALLVWAPVAIVPLEGILSPAARLLAAAAATFLVAIALGAWALPALAVRPYLWVFGVGVKVVGAVLWAATAVIAGVDALWIPAAMDLGVAAAITAALRRG